MDTLFLSEHVLTEDEFMLCESFPSNKYLQGRIKMVWPIQSGILRVGVQLKDAVMTFEVLFHDWPQEYQLKLKDTILILLKGAAKTMKLMNKDKDNLQCPFRVSYKHGARLHVRRETPEEIEELWINYLKGAPKLSFSNSLQTPSDMASYAEQANVNVDPELVIATEDMSEKAQNAMENNSLNRDTSGDAGPPELYSVPKPISPSKKKGKRRKRRHKNKILKGCSGSQGSVPALDPPDAAKHSVDQPSTSTLSSPQPTTFVQASSLDLLAGLPASYTAIAQVTYRSMQSVIGVVTDVGTTKTTKVGDIMRSFILVDPSSAEQGLTINVFAERESQSLLPSANRGQILLLRNVHIQKFNDRPQGTCFKDKLQWCGYDPSSGKHFYSTTEMVAPINVFFPIRSEEMHYFITLATWWGTLQDATTKNNINITFPRSLTDRRSKLRLVSELKEHVFSDCLVELIQVQHVDDRRSDILVTDFSENPDLQCFDTSDFPLGKRTLRVTLWEQANSLANSLVPGKIYLLKNMKIKSYGYLEGSAGGYGFQGIQQVDLKSLQPNLPELLARKQAYKTSPSSIWLRPKSPVSDVQEPLYQGLGRINDTAGSQIIHSQLNSNLSLISEILQSNVLPRKFCLRCRIIDYYPRDVMDFIHMSCATCGKKLEASSKCCLGCHNVIGTAALFTYRFVLRVVDRSDNGMNIRVSGKEAENLLGSLPAKEAVEDHRLLFQRLRFLLGHLYKFHKTFAEEDKTDGPWFDFTLFSYAIDGIHDVHYKLITACSVINDE